MSTRLFASLILAFIFTSKAHAQNIPAGVVLKGLNERNALMRMYFGGVSEGVSWMNILAAADKTKLGYCPPERLAITTDQYESIFERFLKKNAHLFDRPTSLVLFMSLSDAFPCSKKAQ
jgi:hypothetical protein